METRIPNKQETEELWKAARWGVIIFCVLHFLFEIAMDNSKAAAISVMFNFWFSKWYINGQIEKGKLSKNMLLWGLSVAGVVFIIRLVLGIIFTYFMTK